MIRLAMNKTLILIFFLLSTSLYAEWVYVDTASGQGDGQQTWVWKDFSTDSKTNFKKFKMLSVMPSPMQGKIYSATTDVEVYCNDPARITMSNFKYYYDKKGKNIISEYTDSDTVVRKKIPKYTPGYKAVKLVCKI